MSYSLVGVDGNAFAIMTYVGKAMKEVGFTKEEINAYTEDAMSGDYSHVICASQERLDRCNEMVEEDEEDFVSDDETITDFI